MDTTAVETAISGITTHTNAIGGAILLVVAGILVVFYIRRVMK